MMKMKKMKKKKMKRKKKNDEICRSDITIPNVSHSAMMQYNIYEYA